MEEKYLIGLDIGGTKCAVVLGDEKGNVVEKVRFATRSDLGPDHAIGQLLDNAQLLAQKYPVAAVGISCGGPLDGARGVVLSPPNLPGWDAIPICDMVTRRLGVPAFLRNDADACALAEHRYGNGKGMDNMIFLTFGTGMGAGLILNGRLYAGGCNMAGEVGHMRMTQEGPVGYGKAGSFEGWCSGGGIAQQASMKLAGTYEAKLQWDARFMAQAANSGDPVAQELFREVGANLGRGLAVLIDILNPDAIVIGGIYPRAMKLLRPAMDKVLDAECLPQNRRHCRILPALLGESIGDVAALCVAGDGLERR